MTTSGFARVTDAARSASRWVDLQWSFIIADMRAVVPLARGRLLDVGCGDKPYESFFRPYVTEYIGVEHHATFASTSAASRRQPDAIYDGSTLPFGDASFDTVLCVQVLEHTPEPQKLLDEMARVLDARGVLIMTAPFCFRLHEEPHDYFRYSPHGLRVLLDRAGLEVLTLRAQGALFSVIAHKLNTFLAFRVGRLQRLTQAIGGLAHEKTAVGPARYWALPAIVPTMIALGAAARLLDRALPDPTEALSFLVIARHAANGKKG